MIRLPRRSCLPILLLLAACGERASLSAGYAVRDSAGIRIVENTAPAWMEGEEWRLSAEPLLSIGELEGAPEYLLNAVGSALRRSDGTLIVGNSGSQEIRLYDPEGRFVRSIGRKGGGPGEFERLGLLHLLPGDSLLAYDPGARRLSLFSPRGEFVRSSSLSGSPENGFPNPLGVFGDGTLLVHAGQVYGPDQVKDGLSRRPASYFRYSAGGERMDSIATLPGSETWVKTMTEGGRMVGFSVTTLLFGRSASASASGGRVYLGASDAFEIGLYTQDGVLERLIRRTGALQPVREEDVHRFKEERLQGATDESWRKQLEQSLSEMPVPEVRPAFQGFRTDDVEHLWVQEFAVPGEPPRWTVFDPEGRMLGAVEMPDRFRPTHIGEDFVVGVLRDELDVERVLVYALEKPHA